MTRRAAIGTAALGAGVIAITYGLARFVFGLFLPAIRADLEIGPTMAGVIGALPFASFVAAILVAPWVVRTVGVRATGAGAAALALAGLGAIANAPDPQVLAAGVLVCGLSTGLSSPAMVQAVHLAVAPALRGRVNATVNAGTSLGIAAAMPAVLVWPDAWRLAYGIFAGLAAVALLAALVCLPRGTGARQAGQAGTPLTRIDWRTWADIGRLSALALAMGFVSAVYWVFAPDFAVQAGDALGGQTAWMWLAVGLAGLSGAAAGDLIAKYGAAMSHTFAFAVMSAALTLLAAGPGELALAVASAACFGAAYMTLTGFYLVRSVQIMAERPALGPVFPLLATSVGQVVGSPVAGWMIAQQGYGPTFGAFAAVGLAVAALSLWLAAAPAQVAAVAEE
jgi:MFS transporter, DHA1 family, inner membrane transport protein